MWFKTFVVDIFIYKNKQKLEDDFADLDIPNMGEGNLQTNIQTDKNEHMKNMSPVLQKTNIRSDVHCGPFAGNSSS